MTLSGRLKQAEEIDHLRYLRNRAYRRGAVGRVRHLMAVGHGTLGRLRVIHEADERCCLLEPWPLTFEKLLSSLNADGERVAGIRPDGAGIEMLLPQDGA
jgi:hypothetical protein